MTITQPVNNNKAKKNRSRSKNTPAQSRVQEADNSQNSTSIVHPNSGVQHASNVTPIPGQHQLLLQQSSPPWWAWGPPPPPIPWNWNMWSPGAFHQLSLTNPAGQPTFTHPSVMPNKFLGHPSTTTPATSTVTSAPASIGTVQHNQLANDVPTSPHQSPSVSPNSASPVSNPPDTTEEEQPDPLVSALSFSTAPGLSCLKAR